MAYPGSAGAQTTMYQLEVPSGVGPGEQFQAQVAGPAATVTGVRSSAPPTVTGTPVGAYGARGAYGASGAYGGGAYGGPNVVLIDGGAPEGYVEVDEISPAGWCCLIAGCFFFPFNLLGLCMRERRLVPASHIYY